MEVKYIKCKKCGKGGGTLMKALGGGYVHKDCFYRKMNRKSFRQWLKDKRR